MKHEFKKGASLPEEGVGNLTVPAPGSPRCCLQAAGPALVCSGQAPTAAPLAEHAGLCAVLQAVEGAPHVFSLLSQRHSTETVQNAGPGS